MVKAFGHVPPYDSQMRPLVAMQGGCSRVRGGQDGIFSKHPRSNEIKNSYS
jgi:hypothetical protein